MVRENQLTRYGVIDEDVYCELVKHGNLLEMHVCDNVGDHLIGNVYARYDYEEEAAIAVQAMNHRWYAGKSPAPSPILNFANIDELERRRTPSVR